MLSTNKVVKKPGPIKKPTEDLQSLSLRGNQEERKDTAQRVKKEKSL